MNNLQILIQEVSGILFVLEFIVTGMYKKILWRYFSASVHIRRIVKTLAHRRQGLCISEVPSPPFHSSPVSGCTVVHLCYFPVPSLFSHARRFTQCLLQAFCQGCHVEILSYSSCLGHSLVYPIAFTAPGGATITASLFIFLKILLKLKKPGYLSDPFLHSVTLFKHSLLLQEVPAPVNILS